MTNKQGFTIVELVLVIAIVGILGFVGWRVYQANSEVAKIQDDTSDLSTVPSESVPANIDAVQKTEDLTTLEKSIDAVNVEGSELNDLNSQLSFE